MNPKPQKSVRRSLTTNRRNDPVENDAFEAFVRRILRAYARRLAEGDIDGLQGLVSLRAELDSAISRAIADLRSQWGYSWADVARQLGVSRQAAQERYGKTSPQRDTT